MVTNDVAERFTVTYEITASCFDEAKNITQAVQVEQTVEFPVDLLPSSWFEEHVMGHLESLIELEEKRYEARISYSATVAGGEVTQFLNVVFGNSSLKPFIWVTDIELPPSLLGIFSGPQWGLEGIRNHLRVPKRPMLQAVIKPLGHTSEALASMCKAYALGGVDVIKDDHGITNQSFAPFTERVGRCVDAVREGREKSGAHTMYAANVSGDGLETIERAYEAKELGADAIMVAPALVGFGVMQQLAKDKTLGLPIISHPAFAGGMTMPGISGISMPLWFGLLNRLCGADMSIFVSYDGRFTATKEECKRIVAMALDTKRCVKACCPAPGGGVTAERLPELIDAYGLDTMFLVGGDMFRLGPNLTDNTRYLLDILNRSIR